MNYLAFIQRDDVYTNTWLVAQNLGYAHKDIVAHVHKNKERLARMGGFYAVNVKTPGENGRPTKAYALNECQAIFIAALLDNSERVLDFKEALACEFFRMRKLLAERQTIEWQKARIEAKQIRLAETDALKHLTEYARAQGSEHADKLYLVYSKLVKQLADYDGRDLTTSDMLNTVAMLERIVSGVIYQEMAANAHYKAIYQAAKAQLAAILRLWNAPQLKR